MYNINEHTSVQYHFYTSVSIPFITRIENLSFLLFFLITDETQISGEMYNQILFLLLFAWGLRCSVFLK